MFIISFAIPTINRPDDLKKAVESVVEQTRLPDELIIVDQSSDNKSKIIVENILKKFPQIKLKYIWDSKIKGLVQARQVAQINSVGSLLLFGEDDIILEKEYCEQIELGFKEKPSMLGSCGNITNFSHTQLYTYIFKFFHLNIFSDPRINVFGFYEGLGHSLIPTTVLSGGVSAWRKEVFDKVGYDMKNNFQKMK